MMPVTRSGRLHSMPPTSVTTTVSTSAAHTPMMTAATVSSSSAVQHSLPEETTGQQSAASGILADATYLSTTSRSPILQAGDHQHILTLAKPRFQTPQLTPTTRQATVGFSASEQPLTQNENNARNYNSIPAYSRLQHERYDYSSRHNFAPQVQDTNWARGNFANQHDTFKPSIKVPAFSWKGKWNTFISQFEVFAENLHWSESQKRQHLLAALIGDAADFAFELEPESRSSYYELVHHLGTRFKEVKTPETCQRLFFNRSLKRNESVREFGADLKTLSYKAFPTGLSNQAREQMLIKQFFDGLADQDASFQILYLQRPHTLDVALDMYDEYVTFREPIRDFRRGQQVRTVKFQAVSNNNSGNNNTNLQELIERQNEKIKRLEDQLKARSRNTDRPQPRDTSQITCFNCQRLGHYARNCPENSNPSHRRNQ